VPIQDAESRYRRLASVPHHEVVDRCDWPLLALALLAGMGTLWYLAPFSWILIGNYVLAVVVLGVPIWRWLPGRRYGSIAAAWTVGGLLGMYLFGTLVLAAGVLADVGVGVTSGVRRCRLSAL